MQNATPLLRVYRRKLIVGACLLVPAALAILFPEFCASQLHVESWQVGVGGVILFAVVTVWLSLLVRCPGCGMNLFLHAVGHTKGGNWLHWLLHTETCPKCGYPKKG
jgi:hypothetical protein